jgi:hypothetical protein
MIATIYDVDTGEFLWTIDADPEVIDVQTEGIRGRIDGAWDGSTHYVVNDRPVDRPTVNVPASKALGVGEVWTIHGTPDGTKVFVDGDIEGELSLADPSIKFDTAGVYVVKFVPPFPYQPSTSVVTVA